MIEGLLELSGDVPRGILRRLVFEAYRASVEGEMVAVLDPAVRDPVDSALDDAVAAVGLEVVGVRFFHGDRDELIRLAGAARIVVASSPGFRALLSERNLPFCTPEEGLGVLEIASAVPAIHSPPAERPQATKRLDLVRMEAS